MTDTKYVLNKSVSEIKYEYESNYVHLIFI